MRLKYDFEIVDMGNEVIAVPVGQSAVRVHGVIKLNKEAKEIWELLLSDTSEEAIVDTLALKYGNSYDNLLEYVHSVLSFLESNDLLKD